MNQRVVRLPADVVDQEITRDPIDPAAKPTRGKIIPRLAVDAEQSFLREVLGQLSIAEMTCQTVLGSALTSIRSVATTGALSFTSITASLLPDR